MLFPASHHQTGLAPRFSNRRVGWTLVSSSPRIKWGRIKTIRFATVGLPWRSLISGVTLKPGTILARHFQCICCASTARPFTPLIWCKGQAETRVSPRYLSVLYSWFINTSAICNLSSWIYYLCEVMFGYDLRGRMCKNRLLIMFFHSICRILSSGRRPTGKAFHNVSKISAP